MPVSSSAARRIARSITEDTLRINMPKTKIMSNDSSNVPKLIVGNSPIEVVNDYVFLGYSKETSRGMQLV